MSLFLKVVFYSAHACMELKGHTCTYHIPWYRSIENNYLPVPFSGLARRAPAPKPASRTTMPSLTLYRQPAGKLGVRLSADSTISEVHAGGIAEAAGLKVGWLVKSINGQPVDSLQALIKQSVFKFVFEVDDDPSLAKKPTGGEKRKSPADSSSPKKATKVKKSAEAPKAPKPEVHPLARVQDEKRKALLARQRTEIEALKARHAQALAEFERACQKEQVNISGESVCYKCGSHVPGVVEKPHSFQSLPAAVAKTTCCFCQLTRKCSDCRWSVSCAYYPDEHGFCRDCRNKANICDHCDGGCSKCQEDAGCCKYNGGRGRW